MSLPKRPKEHQVEDKSVLAFKRAMPGHWVVRDKSHDYGIDQEVEIFEEDGTATGILFYVQLKATSSSEEKKQKSVAINIGTLRYYEELDLPVLIARYSEVNDEFHFKWSGEVSLLEIPEGQQMKTVTFDDLGEFTDYTPAGLKKTVIAIRKLRNTGEKAKVNIGISFSSCVPALHQTRYIRIIKQSLPQSRLFVVNGIDDASMIDITTILHAEKFLFHIDSHWPTTFRLREWNEGDLASEFLYGLCTFLKRAQLNHHERLIAEHLLHQQYQTQNHFLAFHASTAFAPDISKSLKLALLNNVHHQVDSFWISFNNFVLTQEVSAEDISKMTITLNQASIDQLSEEAPANVIAPHYYNIGNSYQSVNELSKALRSYNQARKINPNYMEQDYFLQEIGSTMFHGKRYTPAAIIYQTLLDRGETDHRLYCLADALFFSGKLRQALELFEKICVKNLNRFTSEVILKSELISALIEHHQKDVIERNQVEANKRLSAISDKLNTPLDIQTYQEIVDTIDPLHALSAFNLAIDASKEKKYEEATLGFLIQALNLTSDAEAWANTFVCAFSAKTIPPTILAAIACLGQSNCGSEFNMHLDRLWAENSIPEEAIAGLESIFDYISGLEEPDERKELTVRPAPD